MTPADPIYVEARRVLLDALEALQPCGTAFVVAGAQAVYLRTGDSDLAVSPYTTDGDLAIDPASLAPSPMLEAAMRSAGFELGNSSGHPEPGIWVAPAVIGAREVLIPVDLIVPEAFAPPGGRRGARLGPHGNQAARKLTGLEAALIDHTPMTLNALDPEDQRSITVPVAGVAALMVAKAHKLHDRSQGSRLDRLEDKDALDVFRLMRTSRPDSVGATLEQLVRHPRAGQVSADGVTYLDQLFGRRGRPGIAMVVRAINEEIPADQVEAICIAYAAVLLAAVGQPKST